MATYFWQGSTAQGIDRFNWNHSSNWRVQSGSNLNLFPVALTAPGAGDVVYVGQAAGGFTALSPILYGGFSGSVSGGNWTMGPTSTGTTANSSLNSLTVNMGRVYLPNTATTTKYPFPYFGGGITGEIYDYCTSVLGLTDGDITGSNVSLAEAGLNLKVRFNFNIATTGRIDQNYELGGLDGFGYPNYSKVKINFVMSKDTTNRCFTYSDFLWGRGSSSRFLEDGFGNIEINNGAFNSSSFIHGLGMTAGPTGGFTGAIQRPLSLKFNRSIVAYAQGNSCDFEIDKSCTFGTLSIFGGPNPFYQEPRNYGYDGKGMLVAGRFNSNDALSELGFTSSSGTTTGAFVSGIFLYDQYTSLPGNTNYDYEPTILIGSPDDGATFSAQSINTFTEIAPYSSNTSNSKRRWNIMIHGSSTITSMSLEGTDLFASSAMDNSKEVSISNLHLSEASVLNMKQNPNFDNWFFGSLTGSTSQATTVIGGINFGDDSCRILGSSSIKLYNTKVINNYDFRAGVNVPVLYGPLEPMPDSPWK